MCPISTEIMKDPLITPAGNTYEGTYINSHIEKNGAYDPLNRFDWYLKTIISKRLSSCEYADKTSYW